MSKLDQVMREHMLGNTELAKRANISTGALKHARKGDPCRITTQRKIVNALNEWLKELGKEHVDSAVLFQNDDGFVQNR